MTNKKAKSKKKSEIEKVGKKAEVKPKTNEAVWNLLEDKEFLRKLKKKLETV